MNKRRFTCGEADWLEVHGIDVQYAALFPQKLTVREIKDLIQCGSSPASLTTTSDQTGSNGT